MRLQQKQFVEDTMLQLPHLFKDGIMFWYNAWNSFKVSLSKILAISTKIEQIPSILRKKPMDWLNKKNNKKGKK